MAFKSLYESLTSFEGTKAKPLLGEELKAMGACAQVLFCMVRSTLITPTEVDIKVLLYKS